MKIRPILIHCFSLIFGAFFSISAWSVTASFIIKNSTPFAIVNDDGSDSSCTSPFSGFFQCQIDPTKSKEVSVGFYVNGASDHSTPVLFINILNTSGNNLYFTPSISTRYGFQATVSPYTWNGKENLLATINFSCPDYFCPLVQP